MKFIVVFRINKEFAEKMTQYIPADAFDQVSESDQSPTKEVMASQGLPEDMAGAIVAHIEHWKPFKDNGSILEGGHYNDFQRSQVIINSDSANQIEEIIRSDPYYGMGVFEDYEIHRWHKVL